MSNALTRLLVTASALAVGGAACTSDPRYIAPQDAIEVNADDLDPSTEAATIALPIRLEKPDELVEREAVAAELGLSLADIPYVKLGDMDVSIEWTLRNLSENEGLAFIDVNGANEWFRFVPDAFIIDATDPNEPPPPNLVKGLPLEIPPLATVSGVVREGQIREGSIDLELITRAAYNPIAAVLQVNEDISEITLDASGVVVPEHLFAGMIEYTVNLSANQHMVLEIAVRVRDQRGLLHDELDQAPTAELTQFAPVEFTPAPPADET